jgi:hypothetical protein
MISVSVCALSARDVLEQADQPQRGESIEALAMLGAGESAARRRFGMNRGAIDSDYRNGTRGFLLSDSHVRLWKDTRCCKKRNNHVFEMCDSRATRRAGVRARPRLRATSEGVTMNKATRSCARWSCRAGRR